VVAENQREIADALLAAGAGRIFDLKSLAAFSDISPLGDAIREQMSNRAQALCDGLGVPRIVDVMGAMQ